MIPPVVSTAGVTLVHLPYIVEPAEKLAPLNAKPPVPSSTTRPFTVAVPSALAACTVLKNTPCSSATKAVGMLACMKYIATITLFAGGVTAVAVLQKADPVIFPVQSFVGNPIILFFYLF